MTVSWHMNDLNISHVEFIEVTRIIKWKVSQYIKMRISRGKVHNCLGMDQD